MINQTDRQGPLIQGESIYKIFINSSTGSFNISNNLLLIAQYYQKVETFLLFIASVIVL